MKITAKLAAALTLQALAAIAVSLVCQAAGCDDASAASLISVAQLAGFAAGLI